MAYQHILIPVDGSDTALAAIQHAIGLAKVFLSQITVVTVISIDPFVAVEFINTQDMQDEFLKKSKEAAQDILDQAVALFAGQGIQVNTEILEGQNIHHELVKASEHFNADLVVIGSHGHSGFKKMILGSVTQSLLSEITIPVLVVRAEETQS